MFYYEDMSGRQQRDFDNLEQYRVESRAINHKLGRLEKLPPGKVARLLARKPFVEKRIRQLECRVSSFG